MRNTKKGEQIRHRVLKPNQMSQMRHAMSLLVHGVHKNERYKQILCRKSAQPGTSDA
jgi:hypothetical protein